MLNKTWDSLHIVCRMTGAGKGTAMGLAEVNIKTQSLLRNRSLLSVQDQYEYVAMVIERSNNATRMVTFPRPDFNLSHLEPGTNYSIKLFAQNKIGEPRSFFCFANFISKL